MVGLPSCVFRPEIKGPRVLQVGWQDDGLVSGFPGQLDAEIPGVESDKGKVEVLGDQVLLGKAVEAVDGVPEGASRTHMFPGQRGEARWTLLARGTYPEVRRRRLTAERSNGGVDRADEDAFAVELGRVSLVLGGLGRYPHLLQRLCVQQNPPHLYDFCRVLRDVDSMLVAGGRHMNDHISIHGSETACRGLAVGLESEGRGARRDVGPVSLVSVVTGSLAEKEKKSLSRVVNSPKKSKRATPS